MTTVTIPTGSVSSATGGRVIGARLALNKSDVARIQQTRGYPAVSVLLAVGPTHKGDRARLAGLVESAAVRLLGEFTRPAIQPLLDDLAGLAATADIGHGHQGLALFANRDLVAAVTLPTTCTVLIASKLDEQTVADEQPAGR